jgi:hypothetical protein
MKAPRLQLNIRQKQEDLAQLQELATRLKTTITGAIRLAVAEKLNRVKAKQKATDQTEAA